MAHALFFFDSFEAASAFKSFVDVFDLFMYLFSIVFFFFYILYWIACNQSLKHKTHAVPLSTIRAEQHDRPSYLICITENTHA